MVRFVNFRHETKPKYELDTTVTIVWNIFNLYRCSYISLFALVRPCITQCACREFIDETNRYSLQLASGGRHLLPACGQYTLASGVSLIASHIELLF